MTVTHSVEEAVGGADAIYTDVWTSMGQEWEAQARLKAFHDYQVNSQVVAMAKKDAVVMHCLPAHRGEEITHEVLESPQCVAFDQAENRLHAQKAIMVWLLNGFAGSKVQRFKGSRKSTGKQRFEEENDERQESRAGLLGRIGHFGYFALVEGEYGCEVIAFCADLGQGEDLQAVKQKAINTGASKVVIGDLREEFVKDYVFPMLRANAVYEGSYLLGTSIARPLIAKAQIDVAVKESADAVSHGATGKGNDQVRFELTYYALKPGIKVIAPWRLWNLNSRTSLIDYARKHGIPVPVTKAKPYSTDRNLFHISYEGGILEDPWKEPPADMFVWCRPVEKAPNRAEYIEIDYLRGDPVAINGRNLSPANLAGAAERSRRQAWHRPGRPGRESLCRHEVARCLRNPRRDDTPCGAPRLESITMDREVLRLRDSLIPRYAEMIYYGYWFAPEREVLQKTIDAAQANVTGRVRLKLYKGNVIVAGRKSDSSLYDPNVATFEADQVYQQADAEGFIRLNALRLRLRSWRAK